MQDLIAHYGLDTFRYYVEGIEGPWAERAVRERSPSCGQRIYTGGEHGRTQRAPQRRLSRCACTLTVGDDTLRFDFSDSAPQTNGFVNCSAADHARLRRVALSIHACLPDLPINQGTLRPIEVITNRDPSATPYAGRPSSAGHLETGFRVCKLVTRLLADIPGARRQARSCANT